jgi:LPS export ABC transporter permease LptG
MTKNSEVIAMKSSGVSLYRISIPVMIVAASLSVMAFWLQDYILPYTEKIAHNLHSQIKGQPPETYSTFERHWIGSSDGFFNYELFNVRKNIMYGFSIYQVDLKNFDLLKRIYARQANYSNGHWILKDGWQRTFENGKMKFQEFHRQQAKLPVNPEYFKTEEELPAEMKFADLKHYIEKMKERGFDFVRFAVDLQAKISFPTVSLILTLIAIPFSFSTGKRGALYGIGLSIVMGIVFWFFLALTKSLGYLEILNPFLAAWTPNILATLLALYLLFKIRT